MEVRNAIDMVVKTLDSNFPSWCTEDKAEHNLKQVDGSSVREDLCVGKWLGVEHLHNPKFCVSVLRAIYVIEPSTEILPRSFSEYYLKKL